MERLLGKITELRKKTNHYKNEINRLLGIKGAVLDLRSGCFPMIFNHLTLTLELLSHYYSLGSRPQAIVGLQEKDRMRKENGDRCIMFCKWLFFESLLSIEYSTKQSVAAYGKKSPAADLLKTKGKYVYLNNIIRNSHQLNLIDDNEYTDWQNLTFLRNHLVHNNGVSDCNRIFDIGGARIEASEDQMMQGNLNLFAILTEVSIERYFTWVKALIGKYGK